VVRGCRARRGVLHRAPAGAAVAIGVGGLYFLHLAGLLGPAQGQHHGGMRHLWAGEGATVADHLTPVEGQVEGARVVDLRRSGCSGVAPKSVRPA
jgi:hypothetical protein